MMDGALSDRIKIDAGRDNLFIAIATGGFLGLVYEVTAYIMDEQR